MKTTISLLKRISILSTCLCLFSKNCFSQTPIYSESFSVYDANTWIGQAVTGGSPYYNSPNAPTGGRNGLINGSYEIDNTNAGATSDGKFLMFWTDNGGPSIPVAEHTFFRHSVAVIPNGLYTVSFEIAALNSVSYPKIQTRLNDSNFGAEQTLTTNWKEVSFTWNAGVNSTLDIELVNNNTNLNGNDFGIDNIKVTPVEIVLPVQLFSFTGKESGKAIALHWETAAGSEIQSIEIEKKIASSAFEPIAVIERNKISSVTSYVDPKLENLRLEYRLKLNFSDGKFEYSNILHFEEKVGNKEPIKVFPSLISNYVTLNVNADKHKTGQFLLVDYSGRIVKQKDVKLYQGNNSIFITDFEKINPGNYVILFKTAEASSSFPVLVKL